MMLGLLAGPDPRDPSASSMPVPDYVARLDDPVGGLRVGLDEKVAGEAHPDVQRMVEQVLAVLGKLGLKRAACAFPDCRTPSLVQLASSRIDAGAHGNTAHAAKHYGPKVRAP